MSVIGVLMENRTEDSCEDINCVGSIGPEEVERLSKEELKKEVDELREKLETVKRYQQNGWDR